MLAKSISTSNHMFGSAIWDKLPKCIFENSEIARVKRGQFQNFQKSKIFNEDNHMLVYKLFKLNFIEQVC